MSLRKRGSGRGAGGPAARGRRAALTALLVLLALLASACGGSALEERQDAEWELFQQAMERQSAAPAEDGTPAEDGESAGAELPESFSLAWFSDRSLDPLSAAGANEDVCALLYEPLFALDPSFEPVNVLCGAYVWDESGLTLTMTLREGVVFSDGSPLEAQDVADTLLRAKASEKYAYRLRNVAAVAAGRDGTVTVTLSAPDMGLTALLDIPIVRSGTEGDRVPAGTGPYVLLEGETACLRANSAWWQGKTLPLESIPLVSAKDQDTAAYLFSSRQTELLTANPTGDTGILSGRYQTAGRPTAVLQYIGFNTASETFSDPEARAAFSRSIPREKLTDAQLAGHALAAQYPISPLCSLYPADLEEPESAPPSSDGAGETAALRFLVCDGDSFRLEAARFIARSLSQGDWEIDLCSLPWEEYLAALEAGDFDLYYGEVRLTADWDLTDLAGTGGALNYGAFSSETVDARIAAFAAAGDRAAAARALCAALKAETPIAPICFSEETVLTWPGVVEGIEPAPGNTFWGLEGWTVHTK